VKYRRVTTHSTNKIAFTTLAVGKSGRYKTSVLNNLLRAVTAGIGRPGLDWSVPWYRGGECS